MGVTTDKINKPFNPRGNDQSPKGYNRAALYSGKALDFDGVNDEVNCGDINIAFSEISFAFHFNADSFSNNCIFQKESVFRFIGVNTNQIDIVLATTGNSWYSKKMTLTNLESKDYFLVATYNGSELKAYLNGVLVDTLSGYAGAVVNTSQNVYVGRTNGGAYYNGKVSNAKIFNTALTAAQVADLYNNPEKVVPTGVADSALKLWLPMMEGAGTTAYNGAPDALGSNVVTNGTFDTDLTGWSTNDFSNGSIVQSSGTALITSNGGSGYPSIWQQVTTIVGERYIVKANFSNNTTGAWFWKFDDNTPLGSTNRVQFIDNDATASIDGVFEFTATSTLSSISAFAEQGNAGSFNFDNVEVLQISNVGTISGATWTHGIGAPVAQTSVIDWNKHTLDGTNEVLIPQGLTSGRDLLGNLFENVRKQGALNLDGKSWAEVHDNESLDFGTGSFTLEAWARVKFVAQGSSYNVVMTLGGNLSSQGTSGFIINSSKVPVYIYNNNISGSGSISEGTWIHMVGVYNETNATIYVNGSQVDQDARTAASITNTLVKQIGRDTTATRYYNDQIAQPRIYNRALTAEEVQRNYNAGKNTYK